MRRSGGALLVSQRRFDGFPLEFDELWQEALLGFYGAHRGRVIARTGLFGWRLLDADDELDQA